jgi:hypothetical protein
MLFWTLVGLVVLAVVICTVVTIAMIRATQRSDFD